MRGFGLLIQQTGLQKNNYFPKISKIDFVCDYYSYASEYLDSYMLGEQLVVEDELIISDVYIKEEAANLTYQFTDIYNREYWISPVGSSYSEKQ